MNDTVATVALIVATTLGFLAGLVAHYWIVASDAAHFFRLVRVGAERDDTRAHHDAESECRRAAFQARLKELV